MDRFDTQFAEEFLQRAADSVPVETGGWAELFLERTETLRGEWDPDCGGRMAPGIREGFALRRVESDRQEHFCEEGLSADRILSACRGGRALEPAPPAPPPAGEFRMLAEDGPRVARILEALAADLAARLHGQASFSLTLEWRRRLVRIAPSRQTVRSDVSTRAALACRLRSPSGDLVLGMGAMDLDLLLARDPLERLARESVRRLEESREAVEAPEGESVVILGADSGGAFFHEACGHALEADLVLGDASVFRHRLGEAVAPSFVGAMDDSSQPGLEGSYACDDEGSSCRGTVLIAKGILKSFLTDRVTGERLGRGTTGNGRRESFRDLPLPRMSNTFLMAGEDDPEEIVRETARGIFVHRLEGGRADTATGEFIFRAGSGRRIEAGRLTAPLRPFSLAGNGLEALRGIERVGGDLSFGGGSGSCGKEGQQLPVAAGQPTLRLRSLAIRPG